MVSVRGNAGAGAGQVDSMASVRDVTPMDQARRLKVAVLDDYQDVVRTLDAFGALSAHDVTVWTDPPASMDVLVERLVPAEAVVLLRERTRITEALLARLPNLRLLSQTGHVPHIDLDACTRHGVTVSSALGGRPSYATAELTWGLILAAQRHIPAEVGRLKAGLWQGSLGTGLHGRTLGIFGLGRLGTMVARVGVAFGMAPLVWGRESSVAAALEAGYAVAETQAELFERSDVVSLHLRLVDGTRGIVGPEDLARMKPDALLVNTSRAELIQPGALVAALAAGRPGRAAVDVYEREPLMDADDPLLRAPNAVCTPHLGYVERDNYEAVFKQAFAQVNAYARGTPEHVRNEGVAPG